MSYSRAHTPGPWDRNIKPATRYPVVFSGRNTHVATACVAGLDPEEVEANIALIAAAPDLLAALKLAYRHLNGGADSLSATEHAEAHRMARAAIARATGSAA